MQYFYLLLLVVSAFFFLTGGAAVFGRLIYGGGTWRGGLAYAVQSAAGLALMLMSASQLSLLPRSSRVLEFEVELAVADEKTESPDTEMTGLPPILLPGVGYNSGSIAQRQEMPDLLRDLAPLGPGRGRGWGIDLEALGHLGIDVIDRLGAGNRGVGVQINGQDLGSARPDSPEPVNPPAIPRTRKVQMFHTIPGVMRFGVPTDVSAGAVPEGGVAIEALVGAEQLQRRVSIGTFDWTRPLRADLHGEPDFSIHLRSGAVFSPEADRAVWIWNVTPKPARLREAYDLQLSIVQLDAEGADIPVLDHNGTQKVKIEIEVGWFDRLALWAAEFSVFAQVFGMFSGLGTVSGFILWLRKQFSREEERTFGFDLRA